MRVDRIAPVVSVLTTITTKRAGKMIVDNHHPNLCPIAGCATRVPFNVVWLAPLSLEDKGSGAARWTERAANPVKFTGTSV